VYRGVRNAATIASPIRGWELAMAADTSFSLLTGNNIEPRRVRAGGVISAKASRLTSFSLSRAVMFAFKSATERWPILRLTNIFGEMALIDSEPRSATAVAITDVELVPISEKQFLFLVSQTPYFALTVMRVLAQRLRATNKSLDRSFRAIELGRER
jgi:hypothetical protein